MFRKNQLAYMSLGAIGLFAGLPAATAQAATLVEVDFAQANGAGPSVGTIASSDSQFTVINAGVTFDDAATALATIGGSASTTAWNYDGTGAAAANPDLHVSQTFGAPTRFDLDLGLAASGFSYTITRVEIDVRASNSVNTTWDFMYSTGAGGGANAVIQNGGAIATQSGADPITTYGIDLTTAITATDSATDWNVGGTGELRFAFREPAGGNNDNLQIDAIRVIGTVVPEPSSLALIGLGALAMMSRRR